MRFVSIKLLVSAAKENKNIISINLDTDYLKSEDDETEEAIDEINHLSNKKK